MGSISQFEPIWTALCKYVFSPLGTHTADLQLIRLENMTKTPKWSGIFIGGTRQTAGTLVPFSIQRLKRTSNTFEFTFGI